MSDNPFSDPNQVTRPEQVTINSVNPFGEDIANQNRAPVATAYGASSPPVIEPSSQTATDNGWYAGGEAGIHGSSGGRVVTEGMDKRKADLDYKAAAAERRNQAMPSNVEATRGGNSNNWPPLPSWCCVGSCFFLDIEVEIPVEFQRVTRMAFYLWWIYDLVLLLNIGAALALFIMDTDQGNNFGMSILWFVVFVPLAFVCWFRPLYKAFRSDSSFNFMLFFFMFFAQICTTVLQVVGIPGSGWCGWVLFLKNLGNLPALICTVISSLLFSLLLVAQIFLIIRVHRIYRGSGANMAKASAEFTSNVMRNEAVQQAAASAGQAAAREATRNALRGNK